MRELREEFDYVLIDAPPLSSCSDAVLLGQMTDGVILVVEANSTRRETARTAKETFEGANVKLLGAILNNRTFPIPEVLYRKL
jgi:succinoglycan biosynthesis transport protein ExoP